MPDVTPAIFSSRRPLVVSLLGVLACAAYMAINVVGNYAGNVTGLFYTGSGGIPPELEAEPTYRVKDPDGYDGQYYHLIAHDPLNSRGWTAYVDNPRLRWRRIGVPAIAAAISRLTSASVHWTYPAALLAFAFAGIYWLASHAQNLQRSPWSGLAFLAIPSVLVSIDRMTVDLALAALVFGFVLHAARAELYNSASWQIWAILCLAPLIRETGMLLMCAWVLWSALRRRWRWVILGSFCALPALLWWASVHSTTVPDGTAWLASYPLSGLLQRTFARYPTLGAEGWLGWAGIAEELALAGIWTAYGCAAWLIWRRRFALPEIAAILLVAFFSLLGRYDIWETAYAAGRTLSPALALLLLIAWKNRNPVYAFPILLILPRIALQYAAQLLPVARKVIG